MQNAATITIAGIVGAGGVPADADPITAPTERNRARCFRIMDADASFNCLLATNGHPTQNVRFELFSIDLPYTTPLPADLAEVRMYDLAGIQWQGNIPENEVRVCANYYTVGWYYARITRADPNTLLSFVPSTGMDRRAG